MKISRRDFIKTNAIAATASAAGITLPGISMAMNKDAIRWDKAPCRFCGTGCSVLVGVKDGRIVATQGDPDAPVNRGLNCIKGYFLSKIQYGKDRLTTPYCARKTVSLIRRVILNPFPGMRLLTSWHRNGRSP